MREKEALSKRERESVRERERDNDRGQEEKREVENEKVESEREESEMGIAAEILGGEGSPWEGGESPGGGNVVVARYRVGEMEDKREVGVTWGSSPLGPSFTITLYNSRSRPHRLLCPLSLSPPSLFRCPSHASLSSTPHPPVHVFWDCTRATFRTSPEPVSHFYVALVSGGSVILLLGDMSKEALRRIRRFLKKSEEFVSFSEKSGSNSEKNESKNGSRSGKFGFSSSERFGGKVEERFGRTKAENFGRRDWGGKGSGLKWGLGLGSEEEYKVDGNDFRKGNRDGCWNSLGNGNRIIYGNRNGNGGGSGDGNQDGKILRQETKNGAQKNIGKTISMQFGVRSEESEGLEGEDGSWEGTIHGNGMEVESRIGIDDGIGNGERNGDGNSIETGKGNKIGNLLRRRTSLGFYFDSWSRKLYGKKLSGTIDGNPNEPETGPGSEKTSSRTSFVFRKGYRIVNWNWNLNINGKVNGLGGRFGRRCGSGSGGGFGGGFRQSFFGSVGGNRKIECGAAVPVELVARRECVVGRQACEGRARLAQGGREHLVHAQVDESGSKMVVRVDGEVAVQVDRLQWHFRGNKTIIVDGEPVDVFWDVYNWLFGGFGGYAVFMFRSDSPVSLAGNSPAGSSSLSAGIKSDTTDSFPDSSSDDGLDVMPYWNGTDKRATYAQAWLGKGGLGNDSVADGDCDGSGFSLTLVAWRHDLGFGK